MLKIAFQQARMLHGTRRVLARQGWAGEKEGFFSILLIDPHKDALV